MQEESLKEVQNLNENTESELKMLTLDKKVFAERCRAFSDQEWDICLRCADTRKIKAEYVRRTDRVFELYDELVQTLNQITTEDATENVEDVIKAIKKMLKQKTNPPK